MIHSISFIGGILIIIALGSMADKESMITLLAVAFSIEVPIRVGIWLAGKRRPWKDDIDFTVVYEDLE